MSTRKMIRRGRHSVAKVLVLLTSTSLLNGCAASTADIPPTTPAPSLAPTAAASPTTLPGEVTDPIQSTSEGMPWLPLDPSAAPLTYFFFFDTSKPPFDDVLVRRAFISAIDRSALLEGGDDAYQDKRPATSFVPAQTLGRDLFNEVGVKFGPAEARANLGLAGYEGGVGFPNITVMAPEDQRLPLQRMADMWQTALHVSVNLKTESERDYYQAVLAARPELFASWWVARLNDPDDFLRSVFHSQSPMNLSGFSDAAVDRLLDQAAQTSSAAERQALYIEVERLLCQTEAVVLPVFHATVDNR